MRCWYYLLIVALHFHNLFDICRDCPLLRGSFLWNVPALSTAFIYKCLEGTFVISLVVTWLALFLLLLLLLSREVDDYPR